MTTSTTHGKVSQGLLRKTARGLLVAVFWLALWEIAWLAMKNDLLMVSPQAVARRLLELAGTGRFWGTVVTSLGRVLLGYLMGTAAGVLLGAAGGWRPALHALLSPMLAVVKAAPVTSFVILALVWIKSYNLSVFISFLVVFPPVYMSVYNGVRGADPALLEVAHVYRFSRWKTLRLCYLPAVAPLFRTAVSTAVGFAWKAGIAGEVLALPKVGIGTMLRDAKVYLVTLDVFCWTAVTILLSLLVEKLVLRLAKGPARKEESPCPLP